jgi:hypothetical protein
MQLIFNADKSYYYHQSIILHAAKRITTLGIAASSIRNVAVIMQPFGWTIDRTSTPPAALTTGIIAWKKIAATRESYKTSFIGSIPIPVTPSNKLPSQCRFDPSPIIRPAISF